MHYTITILSYIPLQIYPQKVSVPKWGYKRGMTVIANGPSAVFELIYNIILYWQLFRTKSIE